MKSTTSIRKIAINEKRVEIDYVRHDFTDDERVLNSKKNIKSEVKPHKDFFELFQELKTHAIPMLELSPFKNGADQKILEKHIVTTLNVFQSDEDDIIMISMNKYLANGKCYSVTSPRIEMASYDYPKLNELETLVADIIEEARLYLKREKHGEEQLELNFEAA